MATQKLRKFPKAGTIGNIVLTELAKNKDVKLEILTKMVVAKFPESKFNSAHLSWYKHQVRKGNYILPTASKAGDKPKPRGRGGKKNDSSVSKNKGKPATVVAKTS